jgi:signal transduction histidine kinase
MYFSEEEIRLSLSDDGRGFLPAKNPSELIRGRKLGLLGMKERAELVGGTFELCSGVGTGTKVSVAVKIDSPLP